MFTANGTSRGYPDVMHTDRENPPEEPKRRWQERIARLAGLKETVAKPAPPLVAEMTALELANKIRGDYYKDRNYLRAKRARWAWGATAIRVVALTLSAAATIMLGLSDLSGLAAWGFALSALVTSVTALEPFFNFRSRWVSADQALARWHAAEEELTLYVAATSIDDLNVPGLLRFDHMRREEWSRFSEDWLEHRRGEAATKLE